MRYDVHLRGFASNIAGAVAPITAFLMTSVLGVVLAGLDYAYVVAERLQLQDAADSAAIVAARELALAKPNELAISATAKAVVKHKLAEAEHLATVKLSDDLAAATVSVRRQVLLPFPILGVDQTWEVAVDATARLTPSPPICLLATDTSADGAIKLDKRARLTAEGCGVFSNSTASRGIDGKDDSTLTADLICSAGGKFASKKGNFVPTPLTDCPSLPDPLQDRPPPLVGGCDHTERVIEGGYAILTPGTYCGGLKVTKGAQVRLSPGIFVMKDGPLLVDGNAALTGKGAGFYLTGKDAAIQFKPDSNIELTAPDDGALAGLLFFEDRLQPGSPKHNIKSNNARILLGTIYLSKGTLVVDADKPVADRSAYTIVVARKVQLSEGPNLVMNSDYLSSNVPVPQGLGYRGRKVALTE